VSHDVLAKARAADAALRELKAAALEECAVHGAEAAGCPFVVEWQSDGDAEELAEDALRTAAEYASQHQAFRVGHVYCYACQSSDCEHGQPPSEGEVFIGYGSTGAPQWQEYFQALLGLEDPRTDLLFKERPEILARLVGRRRLTHDQLVSFGKNSLTYRVWGQVVAGYLYLRGLRAALTIQLVETRDRKLHLQVITVDDIRAALADAPPERRSAFHRVHDALSEARSQTHSLSTVWHASRRKELAKEVDRKAFAMLRHLAHSIERKGRQQQRRTVHAEVRGEQQRPVHKASDDLRRAKDEDLYRDVVRNSVIVRGRNRRLHVFSHEGKHITSMVADNSEVEKRQRRKRYEALSAADAKCFREAAMEADTRRPEETMPDQT